MPSAGQTLRFISIFFKKTSHAFNLVSFIADSKPWRVSPCGPRIFGFARGGSILRLSLEPVMKKSPIILLATIWMCGNGHAEFAMIPSAPSPKQTAAPPVASSPPSSARTPGELLKAKAEAPLSTPLKKRRRTRSNAIAGHATARGFGSQIPLEFAVRQIVPAKIKVIYGSGADHNALVDWQGGKRWKLVLRDAVRPLGLDVRVHANFVSIASSSKSQ